MTIWRWFGVPISTSSQSKQEEEEYLLIWGGSTITGQFAIQIAQRCGINVIAVTSEKTSSLASTLGATVVTRDGKTGEEIVREIRGIAGDKITRAIDLVGTTTASYCLSALSTSKPCLFTPLAMISSKAIIPANITVETVEMKQFVLNPENRVYALELNRLVEEGKLVLPSVEVLEGGLDVITVGLERLKGGDMGGRKMVVRMI
jgi:NADPH:quinone reductase-like Zn-dependent oxidoreductase